MGEKGDIFGFLLWLIIGAIVLFVLGYIAKSFFFSTLAMVFVGIVIVIGGFIFIGLLFLAGIGSIIASVEKRDVKGAFLLLLLIGVCVFGYWSTAYLDKIANSPEVPDAEIGSIIYTGLEGYPIAKTALSTLFGKTLADYLNQIIPSEYHWTVFRVRLPNYINYLCIAEGDFEGLNYYRIQIENIYEFGIFTIFKLNKIEEINVFEASAYIFGHALPFGTLIFKIQSYAFLITIPILLTGAIKCLAAKSAEQLDEKPKNKAQRKIQVTKLEKTGVVTKTVAPKEPEEPTEVTQIKKEIEESKVRHDLGEISQAEFNERKRQLEQILQVRQKHLTNELQIIKRQIEEFKARRLVGELEYAKYNEEMKKINGRLKKIQQELDEIKNLKESA
jgi:hypothetical protein